MRADLLGVLLDNMPDLDGRGTRHQWKAVRSTPTLITMPLKILVVT